MLEMVRFALVQILKMPFMWAWNTLTQTQDLKAVTHLWAAPADAVTAVPH